MNLSFISKGIVCLLSLGSVAHATVLILTRHLRTAFVS